MSRTSTAIGTSRRSRALGARLGLCLALGIALVLSPPHVAPSRATGTAAGSISAHLTDASFPAAQAGVVKLVYTIQGTSHRFGYVLSRKSGTTWTRVRRVVHEGSFTGTHRVSVKSLFGTKPVRTGHYRLRVFTEVNSVTLRFTVTAPVPRTGGWVSTSLSGAVSGNGVTATSIFFGVLASPRRVSQFGFGFDWWGTPKPGQSCSGSGFSAINADTPSPVVNGQFSSPAATGPWSGAGSGSFAGTFDSPTTAHGTAQLSVFISGPGCFISGMANTGTFTWKARLAS